jgi:hypothetical protein
MGQAPHYLEGATNPAVSRALLTYVTCLLDLDLDVSPLEKAVQAFRTRCDTGSRRVRASRSGTPTTAPMRVRLSPQPISAQSAAHQHVRICQRWWEAT